MKMACSHRKAKSSLTPCLALHVIEIEVHQFNSKFMSLYEQLSSLKHYPEQKLAQARPQPTQSAELTRVWRKSISLKIRLICNEGDHTNSI
jgi:hypothetical protein